MDYKAQIVEDKTLNNYRGLRRALKEFLGVQQATGQISTEFVEWYATLLLIPRVRRERIRVLKTCWE